jgi:hypothetical protein
VRSLELLAIVPTSGRKPPLAASTDAALALDTRRALTRHVRALVSAEWIAGADGCGGTAQFAIEHSLLTAALAQPEGPVEPETDDGEWDWHLDATLAREAFPKSLHAVLGCLSVGVSVCGVRQALD